MNITDFKTFFEALHGCSPFPWQSRLAEEVSEKGWPPILDLPTSAGKTAVMDIALFHLALEAEKPASEKKAPLRIFFVVDRRLVVDEAFDRAERIKKLVEQAVGGNGILAEVANKLCILSRDLDAPLQVVRLRGGLPRERAFLRNPLQPAIILSTVDQVGSRLLFRGYGVSEYMQPIHAALTGSDSLVVLDEAHLSRPFSETLAWIKHYQSTAWSEINVTRPIIVVEMTATPSAGTKPFCLNDKDWLHPLLKERLTANKPALLDSVDGDKDNPNDTRKRIVAKLAGHAAFLMRELRNDLDAPIVGVVCNRVANAREVFDELDKDNGSEAILLTGRIRGYEREQLLENYLLRMKAGRKQDANPAPLFVVATQTIEVGADLDFDALVTESTALDALRQRFGRLNRLGERSHCRAAIVHINYGRGKFEDSVYGEALNATWQWLNKVSKKRRGEKMKSLDFGIQSQKELIPTVENITDLNTPVGCAPVLMPAHLDLLVQTSPPPALEPEIAIYLHGVNTQSEDVQIVWRADLPEKIDGDNKQDVIDTVALLPPMQGEILSVPVWAAHAFLAGVANDVNLSDTEGTLGGDAGFNRPNKNKQRQCLIWQGAENSRIVEPNKIHPGCTIVVPSSYGGADKFGWKPGEKNSVKDIADLVSVSQRNKRVLRLHENLIKQWFPDDAPEESIEKAKSLLGESLSQIREGADLNETVDELIRSVEVISDLNEDIREVIRYFKANEYRAAAYPPAESAKGILIQEYLNKKEEFTDDDDSSSLTEKEVFLEDHCIGVGDLAKQYAEGMGIKEELVNDILLAARLHDLGKADMRFQAWLRGGDKIAARRAEQLIAKSGILVPTDRQSIREARKQTGYPKGGRHECYSVAMAEHNSVLLDEAHDTELVIHLIGTHHGRGRPFMPAIEDSGMEKTQLRFLNHKIEFEGKHDLERIGSDWSEHFWRLVRRYGYWGLAYLETLVRLADHKRSEEGK